MNVHHGRVSSEALQLIERALDPVFVSEWRTLLNRRAFERHVDALLQATVTGSIDVKYLFEYGFSRLPEDNDRPDRSLQAYFLVVAHLRDLPPETRSLATDCVVYCETSATDGLSLSAVELNTAYMQMAPTL
jgi:hypothetical protein